MSLPKGFGSDRTTLNRKLKEITMSNSNRPIQGNWNFGSVWAQKYHMLLIMGLISIALVVSVIAIYDWYLNTQIPWEMKKVNAVLKGALDTSNVERKVTYVNDALNMLETYHGNSEWWNPTADTDIDMTKRVLHDTAMDVKKQIPMQNKDNWMILPHKDLNDYLDNEIIKGQDRVLKYAAAWKFNGHSHPFMLFWPFALIGASMMFIIGIAGLASDGDRDALPKKVYYDGKCPCGRSVPPLLLRRKPDGYYGTWNWDRYDCSCGRSYVNEEHISQLQEVKVDELSLHKAKSHH